MTSVFDRILASAPVNAQTARTMGRGVEWNPAAKIQDWYADQPSTKRAERNPGNPEWRDYTGVKVGSLLILGVLVKDNDKRPTSWVCRCVCGCFCTRTTKTIKDGLRGGNVFVPVCGRCNYQRKLRAGWAPNIKGQRGLRNASEYGNKMGEQA